MAATSTTQLSSRGRLCMHDREKLKGIFIVFFLFCFFCIDANVWVYVTPMYSDKPKKSTSSTTQLPLTSKEHQFHFMHDGPSPPCSLWTKREADDRKLDTQPRKGPVQWLFRVWDDENSVHWPFLFGFFCLYLQATSVQCFKRRKNTSEPTTAPLGSIKYLSCTFAGRLTVLPGCSQNFYFLFFECILKA